MIFNNCFSRASTVVVKWNETKNNANDNNSPNRTTLFFFIVSSLGDKSSWIEFYFKLSVIKLLLMLSNNLEIRYYISSIIVVHVKGLREISVINGRGVLGTS